MSIFAALFEHLIGWFYQISQDYGVAIVMITVCVRLLLTFMIPTGIGLYYFVSELFQAVEQFIYNLICVRKIKVYA